MVSLTAFASIFDNKTHRRINHENWESFEDMLYRMSKIPGYKLSKGEKPNKKTKSSPLISPAIYKDNTTRKNENVIEWAGWAALDVDDHSFNGDLETELSNLYKDNYYVCYSTASSSIEQPKFRLVFPLSRSVKANEIKHFWYALNTNFGKLGDRQTKDLSRMYYCPAKYPNANNFIFTHKGSVLDVDSLLRKYPAPVESTAVTFMERLPIDVQKRVIEHREEQLKNKANYDFEWKSYKDCPFVNKKQINDYAAIAHQDGSGRYAMIYKIMTSIAINSIKNKYPITSGEIVELIRQLDRDTSRRYQKRPLQVEAERAIEYAYKNVELV